MNFLRQAVNLCMGFARYQDVLDKPLAASLRYLAAVIAILSTALVVSYIPRALVFADQQAAWFEEKVPPFTINEGRIESDIAQPFRAYQDEFTFILDTTGAVTNPETNTPAGLLLTAENLVFWFKPSDAPNAPLQTQRHALSRMFADGTFDGKYVKHYLQSMIFVGTPMLLVGLFLAALLATLAHAWFFTFAANLLERSHPNPLSRQQLLNIALHAVTPAALVFTVYAAFGLRGVDYWFLYLVVYGIFLIGAANTCRRLLFGEEAPEDESA